MKALALATLLAIAAPSLALAAMGATGGGAVANGMTVATFALDHSQTYRKQHAVFELAQEGKRLKAADGGQLTDAHRRDLHQRLRAILVGNY